MPRTERVKPSFKYSCHCFKGVNMRLPGPCGPAVVMQMYPLPGIPVSHGTPPPPTSLQKCQDLLLLILRWICKKEPSPPGEREGRG